MRLRRRAGTSKAPTVLPGDRGGPLASYPVASFGRCCQKRRAPPRGLGPPLKYRRAYSRRLTARQLSSGRPAACSPAQLRLRITLPLPQHLSRQRNHRRIPGVTIFGGPGGEPSLPSWPGGNSASARRARPAIASARTTRATGCARCASIRRRDSRSARARRCGSRARVERYRCTSVAGRNGSARRAVVATTASNASECLRGPSWPSRTRQRDGIGRYSVCR